MISLIPLSKIFTDSFGNTSTDYKANAGDIVNFQFDVRENIYFTTTDTNRITVLNGFTTTKTFYFPNYESMNGFAVGQNVQINIVRTPAQSSTTTITAIDYDALSITVASLGTITAPSGLFFGASQNMTIYSTDLRTDLFFNLNLVPFNLAPLNNNVASQNEGGYLTQTNTYRASSIDGAKTRFWKANTDSIIVGGGAFLIPQGFLSGNYGASVEIERLANENAYTRVWRFSINNIQSGTILTSLFNNSFYLNYYFDIEWHSSADFENPTVTQWNLAPSNTGLFDEGFRTEQPQSTLTTGIVNDLFFDAESTHEIEITSSSADIILGACFVSDDDSYYKNKYFTQSSLGMYLSTPPLTFGSSTTFSEINPVNAQFSITVNSLSYTAGVHTVNFTFTPNTEFKDFFEARLTDRRLKLWFQVGNTNVLVYDDIMKDAPLPIKSWDDIAPSESFARFRLDKQSVTYPATGPSINGGAYVSLEDNLLLEIDAQLGQSSIFKYSRFQVICVNQTDDSDFFVLESYFTDWSGVQRDTSNLVSPIDGQGIVLISTENSISENIPNTSGILNKISVELRTSDLTTFTVRLRCPLILNWRYWLDQANAFTSFFPNQNKNYLNYQSSPYIIALRTEIESEEEIYRHDAPIDAFYDYDETYSSVNEEWAGTTAIQYFDENGTEQPYLIVGQQMTVKFTVNNTITATDGQTWGQLTIEPTESSPRYLISSNYSADTNPENPFLPLVGETKLKKTIVSGTQVTFEAIIDTDKLTGENQKITGKYFNNASPKKEQVRSKFDTKLLTKFTLPTNNDDCCDTVFKVFANLDDTSAYKNDITSAWYLFEGGDVEFKLYLKDGETLANSQPTVSTFANQSNAKYGVVNWSDVLDLDGAGCYVLKVEYTGGMVDNTVVWGTYELAEWTTDNVDGYVNIRSNFNSNQSIEGINFTGSNLTDSLNVLGFFGNRDPKTEVDNVIYNTRLNVKVTRENLNEYTLTTNPVSRLFTRKLLDLHLLSENDCYITDNNAFNHEQYVYKRVIVLEVPSPEYYQFSKYAKITAKFGDKINNTRSFY
jgi:hypothetical protein